MALAVSQDMKLPISDDSPRRPQTSLPKPIAQDHKGSSVCCVYLRPEEGQAVAMLVKME